MKRHIPTFEQFLNEAANDANGFDPAKAQDTDPTMAPLKTTSELIPGKEYVITLDGVKNTDMIYQGVTDGSYIFNEEDHNSEPKTFTEDAMMKVIAAGGVSQVAE